MDWTILGIEPTKDKKANYNCISYQADAGESRGQAGGI